MFIGMQVQLVDLASGQTLSVIQVSANTKQMALSGVSDTCRHVLMVSDPRRGGKRRLQHGWLHAADGRSRAVRLRLVGEWAPFEGLA
jgi:hypothetical protein